MTEARRRWKLENRERVLQHRRKSYHKNKDKNHAKELARQKARRDRDRPHYRWLKAKWRNQNASYCRAQARQWKARKIGQLHPEHDVKVERAFFNLAAAMARATGEPHHVDHIIPLAHGGWHHHLNMQVLPEWANTSKGSNPFWSVEGFKSWRDVPAKLWPVKLAQKYRQQLGVDAA